MGRHERLILPARQRAATRELKKHVREVGTRYVLMDHLSNPEGNLYSMVRVVKGINAPEGVVEKHGHLVESAMIFIGDNDDLTGLKVEATIEDETRCLQAPVTIYLPPGTNHSFRFLEGSGKYIKIVTAPKGDHNAVTQ